MQQNVKQTKNMLEWEAPALLCEILKGDGGMCGLVQVGNVAEFKFFCDQPWPV